MDIKQRLKSYNLSTARFQIKNGKKAVTVFLTATLLTIGGCATAPGSGQQGGDNIKPAGKPNQMVEAGFDAYAGRKYEQAITLFKDTQQSAGQESNAYARALVGEILIRLSADRKWRDLDRAAQALKQLRSSGNRRANSSVEKQMLMGALNNLLIAEKDNAELRGKLNASYAQLSRLEKEKENLSNALDKLRSLTLD